MSDELLVEREGRILIMRINRPEVRNAVNGAMARAIAAAVDELEADDSLSVGIIAGTDEVFSSGMDLRGFLSGDLPSIKGRGFAGLVERPPTKPLIAAVEGYALAGGCEIAIASDIVIAGESASFGLPEAKRGLVPTGGGALKLANQLPYHVAMELLLSGEALSAERAFHFGFVNRIAPDGKALEVALEMAQVLANNGPLAMEAIKRIVRESPDWPLDEAPKKQRAIATPVFESSDAREGARAFTERRVPEWSRS